MSAGGPPRRSGVGADLRLLGPALVCWVVVASCLGCSGPVLLAVFVGLVVIAGVGGAVAARLGMPLAGLLAVTVLLAGLGLVSLAAQDAIRRSGPVAELAAENATVTVLATVDEEPRRLAPASFDVTGAPRAAVRLLVHEVTGPEVRAAVATPVLVVGEQSWLAPRWQAEVRAVGRLVPAGPAERSVAILRVRGSPELLGEPAWPFAVADHVRARLRQATSLLPADARGLLPGLALGDTSQTPADLTEAMRTTGLTHLAAVSGSNVAIVLGAGLAICRWVGLRRRWRPLLAFGALLAFVVLVRPDPSVLRAAAMGSVGLVGMSLDRRHAGLPALAVAIVGLLAWDPWLARSFGFALSTLASLGLLVLARPWGRALGARLPPRLRWLGPVTAIPVAAQVMCAPVIVLLQGSVSTVSVLTNLLVAPLVAPATILGVVAAVVGTLWSPLGTALATVAGVPTLGIAVVARVGAQVPFGAVPWPSGALGAVSLAALTLALVLLGPWLLRRARSRPVLAAAVLGLVLAGCWPTTALAWPPPGWQLVMCDVGQGDAFVLRTGPASATLVDTGPPGGSVTSCLDRLGISALDAVVLTHDHADHVGALAEVLAGRRVGEVVVGPLRDPPPQASTIDRLTAQAQVPQVVVRAGDSVTVGTATLRVWWPARIIHTGSEPNNASLVMTVTLGGLRCLMLGDTEEPAQRAVLDALRTDRSVLAQGFDVVKVAHHGSAGYDEQLYAETAAPVSLVSVGADNTFGQPAPSTLRLLASLGSRVLRSDQVGDVALSRGPQGHLFVATRAR